METSRNTEILCNCLDCLAWANYMYTDSDRLELVENILSEIKAYPIITSITYRALFRPFVLVCRCRLILLSYKLGFTSYPATIQRLYSDIEKALSIFFDK